MTRTPIDSNSIGLMLEIAQGAEKPRMQECREFPIKIGREENAHISLSGLWVGRIHAEIRRTLTGFMLIDLGTLAGTSVNSHRIVEFGPLCQDDVIQIAAWTIKLRALVVQGQLEQPDDQLLVDRAVGRLREAIDLRRKNWAGVPDTVIRSECRELILPQVKEFLVESDKVSLERFVERVIAESVGLGPLEPLFQDPSITEIMVNRFDKIFVERHGVCEQADVRFSSEDSVRAVIDRIVSPLGRRIDEASPMVDARLPDGSRVNAIIRPLAVKGSSLTIRRFSTRRLGPDDLITGGSATSPMLAFLRLAVQHRLNVVVAGGTGSGKTTLLNLLSAWIPPHERIITIEDAAELQLTHQNLVSLEVRQANAEGRGLVSVRDLLKNSLRMRPDRIVVGECRGGEALDMLQAMNTGHEGSLTTIHANSPRDALSRLEVMVLMAGFDLPLIAIREQIASAVDVLVQQQRCVDGRRRIVSISEVTGVESGVIQTQEIFSWRSDLACFGSTGVVPHSFERLVRLGVHIDHESILGQGELSV